MLSRLSNEKEDPNFDRKLDLAIVGAQLFVKKRLVKRITREKNSVIIVKYILGFQTGVNPRQRCHTDHFEAKTSCRVS
jgi:hypothetical protein